MSHILFPITYKCNLSCKFCCVKTERNSVDIEKCCDVLETVTPNLGDWVYITGGEPFLIEELPAVCDRIKKKFKVGVTTNGTLFRPEIAEHVDRLGISLDGNKEYHDSYRGQGVFDKALNLFQAVKDKCETVIMSTAFKENILALISLKPVIEELNPDYWQIQRDVNDPFLKIPSVLCEG
jgi:MoaA/NifB/PqqE/SkfB family radical SAM enzyme